MWYGKQASPASSTSTVDQDEIKFNDSRLATINITTISNNTNNTHNHLNQQTVATTINHHPQLATVATVPPSASSSAHATTIAVIPPTSTINSINTSQLQQQPQQQQPQQQHQRQTARKPTARASKSSNGTNNKFSPPKRPKLYHLPQQLTPWKSLQHHFLRHTDVKFRPEKRMTMSELGNEVLQRRNGWKVHHLVGQLSDLIQNEMQTRDKISSLIEIFTSEGGKRVHELANNCHKLPEQYAALLKSQRSYGTNEFKPELIVSKLDDLLKGDLQRSNMFDDQLRDCRDLVVRITNEHRDRVARITTKFNKRIQL